MSETANSPFNDSPGLVKTIAILTLINGIVNIFWGLIATASVVSTIVLACLAVFTILPTVLGIFEIIYALKLLNTPPQPVQPSTTIAILEIISVLTGNVFSMVVGILSLVFYNDIQVKEYFSNLNGIPYPVAPETPLPPPVPQPEASSKNTPVIDPAPEPPAPSKPKKPGPRKVARKTAESKQKAEEKPKKTSAKSKQKPKTGDSSS